MQWKELYKDFAFEREAPVYRFRNGAAQAYRARSGAVDSTSNSVDQ
jgi:hypothetical protein